MSNLHPRVHEFETTSEAYDASQWDDRIAGGDVLRVPSERVVGILVGAWPVAITAEFGSFHTLADGVIWANVDGDDFTASVLLAQTVIDRPACAVCQQVAADGITEATDASPELPRCHACAASTSGPMRSFEVQA